jgi:predicted metal-dependent HD superfamily phosphohydrolase
MMVTSLHTWLRIWHELGAAAGDEALHRQLLACWSEPHRHYHTPQHLRECLVHLEGARQQAQRPAEIELALWFHDAFYDVRRDDNEARSADWARDSVLQAGLPQDVAGRIHAMVMATEHEAVPEDADAQLLLDIDLAILGADVPRFEESDLQVRAEYAHLGEEEWRVGRKEVLASFLGRPRLYSTERFSCAYERQARDNLQRAMDRL